MKRIAVIGTMTNNRSPAFTLIESLVVIATIGIMAAIAVPVFNGVAGACERDERPDQPSSYRHRNTAVHERQQRRFPWVSNGHLDVTVRTESKIPINLARPRITLR